MNVRFLSNQGVSPVVKVPVFKINEEIADILGKVISNINFPNFIGITFFS